jgi:hypothetical protein
VRGYPGWWSGGDVAHLTTDNDGNAMSDFAVKLEEARQRLPLRRLMAERGRGPGAGDNWKSFAQCPYCRRPRCAGLFAGRSGAEWFKCFHAGCPSGTGAPGAAWDEIGFLAHELGLNRRDAALTYLKEAGVWKEQDGQRRRPGASPESEVRSLSEQPPAEISNALPWPLPASREAEAVPSAPENEDEHPQASVTPPRDGATAVPGTPGLGVGGVPASPAGPPSWPEPGEADPFAEAGISPQAGEPGESGAVAAGTDATPPVMQAEGGRGEPPELAAAAPRPRGPVAALRYFYERLILTEEDAEKLWRRRGLLRETCEALGFRSSLRSNERILLELRQLFPMNVLLDAALWVKANEPGAEPRPNLQYCGWGVAGKSKTNAHEWEYGWTFPILIPYADAHGEVIDLRPHKRTQKGRSPRVYVPRPLQHWLRANPDAALAASAGGMQQFALVTEGEFKAAAVTQTLADLAAVAALPGITMAKPLFGDVMDWLMDLGVRHAVVAYDNEEKGDPKLPGYKEEKWKRYDSEVWAWYLCRRLTKEGFDAQVAHLPVEWRDGNGKADWDGALARLTGSAESALEESAAVWAKKRGQARGEFLRVIKSSARENEVWEAGLYESETWATIKSQLERVSYVRRLPEAGEDELRWSRRLLRLADKLKHDEDRLPAKARGYLFFLARRYAELKGGYYILRSLREATEEQWKEWLSRAGGRDDVEVKRACELVCKGIPESISDFTMEAMYVLEKVDGTRDRMVRIHNIHGKSSGVLSLPASAFSQPSRLREWLLNSTGCANWRAGERELNDLQMDVGRDVAWKEVLDVPLRGYHPSSGLWFFEDVAYSPEGTAIHLDRQGIVWYRGKAYRPSDRDQEREVFRQSPPLMRPQAACSEEQVRALFVDLARRLFETLGGYSGHLALGTMLSYGAAPEIYERYVGFPGLWLHGESQSGKSSIARWLLRLWGFSNLAGVAIPNMTSAGLGIALQQYGNLPLWLEEFQPSCPEWMIERLKGVFDRTNGSKKTMGDVPREVRTGAIVTGVATSEDSQLRSRYCHVHVSKANRQADHYRWFEAESLAKFHWLGRYLLQRRQEFARRVMEHLHLWIESKALLGCDERARIVHGAAYASFYALVGMLESHEPPELHGFKEFLLGHVEKAVDEVREQVYVNQFWTDLLAALKFDEFGHTWTERQRIFKVVPDASAASPVSARQAQLGQADPFCAWQSYRLYFIPDAVIDRLRAYKRRMGQDLPLSKSDLRAQMKARPYWVNPKGEAHFQRFSGSASNSRCWCIDLDRHELGYREVADEEFAASFQREDGTFFPQAAWADPRRGDLFALVDALKEPPKESP